MLKRKNVAHEASTVLENLQRSNTFISVNSVIVLLTFGGQDFTPELLERMSAMLFSFSWFWLSLQYQSECNDQNLYITFAVFYSEYDRKVFSMSVFLISSLTWVAWWNIIWRKQLLGMNFSTNIFTWRIIKPSVSPNRI